MYITNINNRYPCTGYAPRDGTAVFSGIEGLELPVEGLITLCRDDGFVLAEQDSGGYARQTFVGGVLVLTNEPEPVTEPGPAPDRITTDDLAEQVFDLEVRTTMLEQGVK